jgi:uncharacterized protein (UPF0264 family)
MEVLGRPRLLVSVRSAAEVAPALAGGAALIDVKEPARGPLGRADDDTVGAILDAVAGRCPVSAALGELRFGVLASPFQHFRRCQYLKLGLSLLGQLDWRASLNWAIRQLAEQAPGCEVVTVAYADWLLANAPPLEEVCAFARARPGSTFLLDTYTKGVPGPTLLDFLSPQKVALYCRLSRAAGLRVAIAGSLGRDEIERLLPARPDWFAVRGAVCDNDRNGAVNEDKVRDLTALLGGVTTATGAD